MPAFFIVSLEGIHLLNWDRSFFSDEARAAAYPGWLHHFNHHRPHGGNGGARPSDRVHNLTGNYS